MDTSAAAACRVCGVRVSAASPLPGEHAHELFVLNGVVQVPPSILSHVRSNVLETAIESAVSLSHKMMRSVCGTAARVESSAADFRIAWGDLPQKLGNQAARHVPWSFFILARRLQLGVRLA